jgi:hypothetical protein
MEKIFSRGSMKTRNYILALLITFTVFCAVPKTMNYQGKLTDLSGVAIDDPTRKVAFLIYDALSGGTLQWAETLTVGISKGMFDVQLGAIRTLNLSFANPYWMQLKVDQNDDGDVSDATDELLSPRTPLSATPYSFRAIYADSANTGPNGWTDAGTYIYPNNASLFHIEDDGDLDLGGKRIERVDELSANTIDPVLQIGGKLYRTWSLDMVGQRAEVIGQGETDAHGFFELDISSQPEGSDLWLFWNAVDTKTITVFVSANSPVCIYGNIEGVLLKVGSVEQTAGAKFSYRLIGVRKDFRDMTPEETNRRTKPTETFIDIDSGAKYKSE